MSSELEERAAVVAEALTWRGTRFHEGARVKGAGVDCGQLLLASYETCGIFEHVETGQWTRDWFLHEEGPERYLELLDRLGLEAPLPPKRVPLPGDAVIWRFGRKFSHGGIVVRWPFVVHVFQGRSVAVDDYSHAAFLNEVGEVPGFRSRLQKIDRPMKVYVPKRWA